MADKKRNAFVTQHAMAAGLIAVTLLAVLIAVTFYWQQTIVRQSRGWVIHSYEVTSQINALSHRLKEADLNHRGYMLTGNDRYRLAYIHSIEGSNEQAAPADESRTLMAQVQVLHALVSDNLKQLHGVDEIEGAVKSLISDWQAAIDMKQQNPARVSPEGITSRTVPLLEQVNHTINELGQEEARLLAQRTQLDQQTSDRNHAVTFFIMTLFYAGMVGAVWLAAGQWKQGRHMESEISSKTEENVSTHAKLEQANSELAESRAFLKNIINHVADPIFVKDKRHRWIDGNNAFWSIMGRPEEDVRGRSDYEFFSKDQADVFWLKDQEVFDSGRPNINIESLTDAGGVTHIISTKKARFEGPSNEMYLVGVIRDITELTRVQEKLKESDEARLKSIMEHAGRPVYIKDLQGKYLQINRDLLAILV